VDVYEYEYVYEYGRKVTREHQPFDGGLAPAGYCATIAWKEDAMHIEQLLQSIQACLCAPDPLPAVEALLHTVVSDPAGLREALRERNGGEQSQGFDVFCRSATLTVFHASLAPGFRNAPHDHGTWAVVGVYDGTERNRFFRRRGRTIVEDHRVDLTAPQVIAMRPGVIHAIANPLPTPSRAIHVYGNDHFDASRSMWHPVILREQPYAMETFRAWSRELARGL
jgi:predicted metal-dependent enzyme (double-stranded beta helix superfamily)